MKRSGVVFMLFSCCFETHLKGSSTDTSNAINGHLPCPVKSDRKDLNTKSPRTSGLPYMQQKGGCTQG